MTFPIVNSQLRRDWYETESQVTIEIFLKNQKAEDVTVDFTKDTVAVQAKLPSFTYELNLDLSHEIDPEKSYHKVLSTKIEVRLCKVAAGKWSVLERKPAVDESGEIPPTYPTSCLKKHDWDKLEKEVIEEAEKDEKDVNELFKKIYSDADEEVRRAMNKSFMESGGTVLSTNWKEVGRKKVDPQPPKGTEYKKLDPSYT